MERQPLQIHNPDHSQYGHKVLQINGVSDHVHILFGMRPNQSLSELMKEVKQSSSKWINNERLAKSRFAWQSGYGAFSYAKSELPYVIRYIENQENHHQTQSFKNEYKALLEEFSVEFDDRYLFEFLEP